MSIDIKISSIEITFKKDISVVDNPTYLKKLHTRVGRAFVVLVCIVCVMCIRVVWIIFRLHTVYYTSWALEICPAPIFKSLWYRTFLFSPLPLVGDSPRREREGDCALRLADATVE